MHVGSVKRAATGLCIALTLAAVAGCGSTTSSSSSSSSSGHGSAKGALKVALVLDDPPNDQGWGTTWINAAHQLQQHFGSRVNVTWQVSIPDPETGQAITSLIQQGYNVIVTTTFGQQQAALQAAAQHPGVTFFATEAITTRPNLATVDALQADGFYVAGMAAAAVSKGGTNGVVGAFPVPVYLADANGYELGARAINPNAKTKLIWSNDWNDPAKGQSAARALVNSGASTLTTFMSGPGVLSSVAKGQNIPWVAATNDMRTYAPQQYLTGVLIDWAPWLENQISQVLNHTWKSGSSLLTLQNGGVKVAAWGTAYSKVAPSDRAKIAKALRGLKAGTLHAFTGPIKSQTGRIVIASGQTASDGQLRSSNYLVAGIEGSPK